MSLVQKIKVIINGKFLTGGQTAVHKVAEEYALAFDRMVVSSPEISSRYDFVIMVPPGSRRRLDLHHIPIREVGFFGGVLWEQILLPYYARSGVLLNFCNLGPAIARKVATLIHDVQAYTTPESNSQRFRVLYKTLTPLIIRFHNRIYTVSTYSADEIRALMLRKKEIIVVHNGCDHILRVHPDEAVLQELELTPGSYCVALANPKPHKNIGILLAAFADARLSNIPLVLFGPGKRRDFEERGITIPPQVIFAGRLPDESLTALIGNAGALAFPSLTEGFGLPPLEAMALGCPVIIAPRGALPEICGNSVLSADPYQAAEWAEKLCSIFDDVALSSSLREAGLARSAQFRWERSAAVVLKGVMEIMK